jgi:two-component system response regulator NreC
MGHQPHVLVLDLEMPNGSSIETIRRLHETTPETEIVVLTMEESAAFAQRALEAGAIGFVLKDRADNELALAVRAAARGDEFLSPHIAASLEWFRRATGDDGLSPREMAL